LSHEPSDSPSDIPTSVVRNVPTQLPACVSSKAVGDEDLALENVSELWVNGYVATAPDESKFLSAVVASNAVSRTFAIPTHGVGTGAESVTMEFSFYRIGGWQTADRLSVTVGSLVCDLGNMFGTYHSDDAGGITCWRDLVKEDIDLGSGTTADKVFQVSLTIPGSHVDGSGNLVVQLLTETSSTSANGGYVDLMVTANYECVESEEPSTSPTSTPSEEPSMVPSSSPSDYTPVCLTTAFIIDEDFEGPDAASSWSNGVVGSTSASNHFLGPLQSGSPVGRSLDVTGNGLSVPFSFTLEFVLYQIGDWQNGDTITVSLGSIAVDLGIFTSSGNTAVVRDVESGISWWRMTIAEGLDLGFGSSLDRKYLVEMEIPAVQNTGTVLDVEFVTSSTAGLAGVDELSLISNFECVEEVPLARSLEVDISSASATLEDENVLVDEDLVQNSGLRTSIIDDACIDGYMTEQVIVSETFEKEGDADSWTDGESLLDFTSYTSGFLGRLGLGHPEATKTFTNIPLGADNITIEFDFYELGRWNKFDSVILEINDVDFALGDFVKYDPLNNPNNEFSGSTAGGIQWKQRSTDTPNVNNDQTHAIWISIPKDFFSTGALTFRIHLNTSRKMSVKSGGIDNFKVTAYGKWCQNSIAPVVIASKSYRWTRWINL